MNTINKILEDFCIEKNLELIFPEEKLQACSCSEDFLDNEKYSVFIIIKENKESDLMIRELRSPIIQNMSCENSPKNCFYCRFGCSIGNSDFLRVIIVEGKKKAYSFSKETISQELHCSSSDWNDT